MTKLDSSCRSAACFSLCVGWIVAALCSKSTHPTCTQAQLYFAVNLTLVVMVAASTALARLQSTCYLCWRSSNHCILLQIVESSDDAFMGLLRENTLVGYRSFGPTLTKIITDQFHRVLFGKGGHYWANDEEFCSGVREFEREIRSCTLAEVCSCCMF